MSRVTRLALNFDDYQRTTPKQTWVALAQSPLGAQLAEELATRWTDKIPPTSASRILSGFIDDMTRREADYAGPQANEGLIRVRLVTMVASDIARGRLFGHEQMSVQERIHENNPTRYGALDLSMADEAEDDEAKAFIPSILSGGR